MPTPPPASPRPPSPPSTGYASAPQTPRPCFPLERQPDPGTHPRRREGRRTGRRFKPRMPDRNGAGPRPREGDRDARHHAGRRQEAGGRRSETTVARYTARETAACGAVARFYEQEGSGRAVAAEPPREPGFPGRFSGADQGIRRFGLRGSRSALVAFPPPPRRAGRCHRPAGQGRLTQARGGDSAQRPSTNPDETTCAVGPALLEGGRVPGHVARFRDLPEVVAVPLAHVPPASPVTC